MSEVEHVLAVHNALGEGPLWDAEEKVLYWVDIVNGTYYRYDPASGEYEVVEVGVPIGVLALRASGGLVLATKDGFAFWNPQTRELDYIARPHSDKPYMRFNDGAVDSAGRFWAGTMAEGSGAQGPEGVLYRLDPDGSLHEMEHGIGVSNGIGWSPDTTIMYFTDSPLRTIDAYDFDAATGNISNRRTFARLAEVIAVPDGLAVDSEGYVWSACWNGAKIVRYDPAGNVERVIEVPALRPTSCVFGGENLDELYITSSRAGLSAEVIAKYPFSGDLFRLKTDVKGLRKHRFRG